MSSPEAFPLLKLPFLAVNQVLLHFHVGEMIHFSSLSRRTRRIVKASRCPIENVCVRVWKDYTEISMKLNGKPIEYWFFDCELLAHKCQGTTMHFQDTKIQSFIIIGCIYTYADKNNQEYIRYAIDLIIDLFRCSISTFELEPDGVPENRRPFLLGFTSCKNLEISGQNVLEAEELTRTLHNCSFQILRLDIPIPPNFTFPVENWNRLDCFANINHGTAWITGEIFMALKADIILIHKSSLTTADCRRFVERWVSSSDDHFTILLLSWEERVPEDMDFDNLGVELVDFDRETRDTHYWHPNFKFPIAGGKDMVRADGVQATVNILHNFFMIGVWKES